MPHTISTWLKTIRALNGWKQADLARHLGVSRTSVSYYENGGPLPMDLFEKLRSLGNIANIPTMPQTPLPSDVQVLETGIRGTSIMPRGMVLLPLAPSPQAGAWMTPTTTDSEGIEVDAKFGGEGRFVSHMEGDSMLPFLEPNDTLVWQESRRPKLNRIVYAWNGDGQATVKQLKHDGTDFVLCPLNDRYENATAALWETNAYLVGVIRSAQGTEITLFSPDGLIP